MTDDASGRRPQPEPAWITLHPQPCVVASCTDCGEPFGDEESGTHWHFDSVEHLVKAVTDVADDFHPDHGPWQIVGTALLCRNCAERRVCAQEGHRWEHQPAHASKYGSRPEYWSCDRCPETSLTDPVRS